MWPILPKGREMAGSKKLASLRKKMKEESSIVLEYLEKKKCHENDLILEDIEKLLRKTEKDGNGATGRKMTEDLLPEGWTEWWKLIDHQFVQEQRGWWRRWWSRIEAECRRDRKRSKGWG